MDKKDLVMLIMAKKTLDYNKDPNPDNWVTMKGSHVHLENGKIDGGAGGKFNGQSYKGSKKQAHAGKSTETKTENKADLEKRLKELKSKRDDHYWTITRSNSANKTETAGKELAKVDAEIADIEKKLGKRKEFHELTKEQARRAHGMPENKHKERVEKALKEGKTVPENVLAEYPDLKEKYGKPEIKTKEDALKRVAELYKEQDKPGFEKNPKANEMLEERAKLVEKFGINYSDVKKAYEGKPETKSPAASEKLSKIAAEYKKYDTDIAKYAGQMAKIAEKDGEDAALAWANKKMQEISESDLNPVAKGYHRGRLKRVLEEYEGKGPVMKAQAKEPKLGAPKMAEGKSDFPLKEKNDDFYKKQAQATMRHWLIQKNMENTAKNKREIADEVRYDVEFWAEKWKRNYEIAKTDSRYTEKEVASLKEKAEGAQKELEWFNKLWPKKK